jgi:hypothetical protein
MRGVLASVLRPAFYFVVNSIPIGPMLPNFFIVGAPKAGTTSIFHYLDQHPEVYMSPVKEPCHFASEIRPENFCDELQPRVTRDLKELQEYLSGPMTVKRPGGMVLEWENYLKLFAAVRQEKAIGEASIVYLWSKTAGRNIASKIPDAKIVMILRDPAERAFSHYLHAVTLGNLRRSFREQIKLASRDHSEKFSLDDLHLLEIGLYYEQVKRYLDLFPKANICLRFYEDYSDRPAEFVSDLFRFLGVDSTFAPDLSKKHLQPRIPRNLAASDALKKSGLWQFAKRITPPSMLTRMRSLAFRPRKALVMDRRERDYLIGYYREDIRKLSSLANRDLGAWLQ